MDPTNRIQILIHVKMRWSETLLDSYNCILIWIPPDEQVFFGIGPDPDKDLRIRIRGLGMKKTYKTLKKNIEKKGCYNRSTEISYKIIFTAKNKA